MDLPRLRQAVLAAHDLEATCAALRDALGLGEPFHDVGVGHFGLRNAVYALGDCFLEVVSPSRPDTAAGRRLERAGGDCGYMAMFELADAEAIRRRLDALGVRVVWETVHDDIVDLHLHPKDVPGAIVALDVTNPPGSWRWGGPAWTARVPEHSAASLRGMTVATADPVGAARRWAAVVGAEDPGGTTEVVVGGGAQRLRFVAEDGTGAGGIVGIDVTVAPGDPTGIMTVGNVQFDRREEWT
jgi:hypothetical protein